MTGTEWIYAGLALAGGAVVGAVVAVATRPGAPPAVPVGPAPGGAGFQPVSSQALLGGVTYFVSAYGTNAAHTSDIAKQLQAIGFQEAGTKGGLPRVTPHAGSASTALVTFAGAVGTTMPAPTPQLTYAIASIPTPEVLSA